jgi:P27 family predicted phage terminase small subunit
LCYNGKENIMGGQGSGRIPKPRELKLVEGRAPGRDSGGRKVPPAPRYRREAPEAPERLHDDAAALAVWHDVVAELEPQDILSPHHRELLACFCEAVSDYVAARAILAAEGRTIANPQTGHKHPHPALADMRASRAEMLRLGREYGLTPASEQRVAVDVPDDNPAGYNPFAEPPPWKRTSDGAE